MDKITLSLHDIFLKERIKEYARQHGVTVSVLVENYFKNLLKLSQRSEKEESKLPDSLEDLINGIEVDDELKTTDYKTLRNRMYESRSI